MFGSIFGSQLLKTRSKNMGFISFSVLLWVPSPKNMFSLIFCSQFLKTRFKYMALRTENENNFLVFSNSYKNKFIEIFCKKTQIKYGHHQWLFILHRANSTFLSLSLSFLSSPIPFSLLIFMSLDRRSRDFCFRFTVLLGLGLLC